MISTTSQLTREQVICIGFVLSLALFSVRLRVESHQSLHLGMVVAVVHQKSLS